jgi:hypothetical protein
MVLRWMAGKRRAVRRDKTTGELEQPWAGYRANQEWVRRTMTPEERHEAMFLAELLTTTGLPAGYLDGPLKSDLGPLFDGQ